MAERYWLMKSEPTVFSIEDLRRAGATGWDGVRNYQARNFMKEMRVGEKVLFYHSNAEPSGVAGIAEVVRSAYPDPTQFDPKDDHFDAKATTQAPRWFQVDVAFVRLLPRFLPLQELRSVNTLRNMALFTRSRLSVQPVTKAEWDTIQSLARR